MTILTQHNYRLAFKFGDVGLHWKNYETKKSFSFPSGVALKIGIGVIEDDRNGIFYDFSEIASLKLEIKKLKFGKKAPESSDPAFMSKTSTIDFSTFELSEWNEKASQHASFEYASSETALLPGEYWMVISGINNSGGLVSFGFAKMEVLEDGTGLDSTAVSKPSAQYDAATVDSLLAMKQAAIDALQADLDQTRNDLDSLEIQSNPGYDTATIDALLATKQASIDALQADLDQIRNDLNSLEISDISGLQEEIDSKTSSIDLGVADPRVAPGVPSGIGTEGLTNEDPPRVFKKLGPLDTDWEQGFYTENGIFKANIALPDATGLVLPQNVPGIVGRDLRIGDGTTPEGLSLVPSSSSTYYVDYQNGDDATGGGVHPYKTQKAAMEAAIADNPDDALIVMRACEHPVILLGVPQTYTANVASSTRFYFWFEPGLKLTVNNSGTFLNNSSGNLDVRFFGGFIPLTNEMRYYNGPGVSEGDGILRLEFHGQGDLLGSGFTTSAFIITSGLVQVVNFSDRLVSKGAGGSPAFEIQGGKVLFRNLDCAINDGFAGNKPYFTSVSSGAMVFFDNSNFKNYCAARILAADGKVVLKNCLHSTDGTSTYDKIIICDVASTSVHFVGDNYSSEALDSNTVANTGFGSFTQLDPVDLII